MSVTYQVCYIVNLLVFCLLVRLFEVQNKQKKQEGSPPSRVLRYHISFSESKASVIFSMGEKYTGNLIFSSDL